MSEWTPESMGRKGGLVRAARLSPDELAAIGRKGGRARVAKQRAREAAQIPLDNLALGADPVGDEAETDPPPLPEGSMNEKQQCQHRDGSGCADASDIATYRAGDECPTCGCTLGSDGYWYTDADQAPQVQS